MPACKILRSRRERKKVEMVLARLKRILKVDHLCLRGPNGARDEFQLAAAAQNLWKLAKPCRTGLSSGQNEGEDQSAKIETPRRHSDGRLFQRYRRLRVADSESYSIRKQAPILKLAQQFEEHLFGIDAI